MSMNITLTMVDTKTGEILANTQRNYALQISNPSDAGFKFLRRWLDSVVRGVRSTNHKSIELRCHMEEDVKNPYIPFEQ